MMETPSSWSKFAVGMGSMVEEDPVPVPVVRESDALSSATPPPGRMPSSTAARVAFRASS